MPLKGRPNEAETIALFSSFTADNEQPLLWYLCKAGAGRPLKGLAVGKL
jgi:hypothetical protein